MANLIKRGRVWYGRWWQDGKPAWKSLSEDRVIAQQKFTEILINLRAKKLHPNFTNVLNQLGNI